MGMPVELTESTLLFYRNVIDRVTKDELPFLVGGAFAMGAYTGINRFTKDLDLFIKPTDVQKALEMCADAGYRTELTDPVWLAKAFSSDGDFVDFIYRSGNGLSEVDDAWFERSMQGNVFGIPCHLCPPEEVIYQKAFIMERERYDGADIAHYLLTYAEKLDWDHLVERFGPHWRVLLVHLTLFGYIYPGHRSKIPKRVMTELTDKLRTEEDAKDKKLCQGTFLSRASYLIDTLYWGYKDLRFSPRNTLSATEAKAWEKTSRTEQEGILKERGMWLSEPQTPAPRKKNASLNAKNPLAFLWGELNAWR